MPPIPDYLANRIADLKEEIRLRQELLSAYERVVGDISPSQVSNRDAEEEPNIQEGDELRDSGGLSWRGGAENASGCVRNAIRHMDKDFTLHDIAAWLRAQQMPQDNDKISFVLYRFAKNGEIKVKERGAGKRPTVYENPLSAAPAANQPPIAA